MRKLLAVLILALAGCAASGPVVDREAAQRDVYAAKEGYGISERLATAYASLARCKVPAVLPCSDQKIVDQITKARNVSRDSLAAAQGAVDNPNFGIDIIQTAVISAQAGEKAFASIANKYGSK